MIDVTLTFSEFGIMVFCCTMFYLIGCFHGVNYNPPKKSQKATKKRKEVI